MMYRNTKISTFGSDADVIKLYQAKECAQMSKLKQRRKTAKISFWKSDNFQCYTLAAIPLFLVFLFSYVPMFGIIIAFKDYKFSKGIFGSEWVGLENFKFLVLSNDFPRITWNTLYMNFLFIVCGMAAAILVAVLLHGLSSRGSTKVYQTVMITPNFLSWVIVAYMAYALLHPQYGVINGIITSMGGKAVDWYSKPKAWPFILLICNVWKHVGMNSILYYATLMSIDVSLFEACKLEGANRFQIVRHIMIPHLVPLIIILLIMSIGSIFRADFGLFYQITRNVGTLYETTDVLDTYIFRTMREIGDMGLSTAAGLLQSFVGFVLVILTNTAVKKIDPEKSLF